MKNILFPTDFSACSIDALDYASSIAAETGATLTLLHVMQPPPMIDPQMPATILETMQEENEKTAKEKLQTLCNEVNAGQHSQGAKKPVCNGQVVSGLTVDEILFKAKSLDADLLVLGTHGATGLKKVLMGSNAASLIGKATCPILTVPPGKKFTAFRNAVFATDLHVKKIFIPEGVMQMLGRFGAEVLFLFVDTEHTVASDQELADMTALVREKIKYPKISGYICTDTHVADGINHFLKAQNGDLLLMVTHHRNFWQSLTQKSLTKEVAYHLQVPLLSWHQPQ